jgi:hypothetical protein
MGDANGQLLPDQADDRALEHLASVPTQVMAAYAAGEAGAAPLAIGGLLVGAAVVARRLGLTRR